MSVPNKTCDSEFKFENGKTVSGCPWNMGVKLSVGDCMTLCNQTFADWFPKFVTAIYSEVFMPSVYRSIDFNSVHNFHSNEAGYSMCFIAMPEGSKGFEPNWSVYFVINNLSGMKIQFPSTNSDENTIKQEQKISDDTLQDFSREFVNQAYRLLDHYNDGESIEIVLCLDSGGVILKNTFGFPISYYFDGDMEFHKILVRSRVYIPPPRSIGLDGCKIANIHPVQEWEQKEAYRDDMSKLPGTFQMQVGDQMKSAGLDVHQGNTANELVYDPGTDNDIMYRRQRYDKPVFADDEVFRKPSNDDKLPENQRPLKKSKPL